MAGAEQIRIALAQVSASAEVGENVTLVRDAVADAAARGAKVVVLPEATMARFGTPLHDLAQPLDGDFATEVRRIAQQHHLVVVVGMFTPAPDERVHNTLLATGPGVDTSYDKIHLYDAFGSKESDTIAPGNQLVTFDAFGTTFGLATCYDLRFASQFADLGRAGASIVLVPASWGDGPGKAEQWDLLTRARAMDAQAWLVACDQAWTQPEGADPLGIGRSVVVDPLGGVRGRLGHASELLVVEVEPGLVPGVRERVPIL